MYILEESQQLEDTIENKTVQKLHQILRKNESSGNYEELKGILGDKLLVTLIEEVWQLYKLHKDDVTLDCDQREALFKRLELEKNDVAALLLTAAATLTQLFVIDNFTGPVQSDEHDSLDLDVYKAIKSELGYQSLTSDGCEVYHLVRNPWQLKTAQVCWLILNKIGASRRLLELEFLVWKHRLLTVHLATLHEPSEILLKDLKKLHEYIFDHHIINDLRENKTQLARFNLVELCCELAQSAMLRNNITSSNRTLDYASEISGISIEHTGVLGKRTKFQQADIPQLVIRVSKSGLENVSATLKAEDSVQLPRAIELDDDTLLPDVSFVKDHGDKESTCTEQDLTPEAQLLMLTRLDYILKTEVMEESLKDEWTLAYVRSIIRSATIWGVKYKALAIRSGVERKQMRKVDRALVQLEELIRIADERPSERARARLQSFYSILPLSRWQMQRSLGDISFDLGLFKNALEVYGAIEYWEGMIKCHSCLGETAKSEALIRQELSKIETPYLYCLLGDATDNLDYYERSWSLSGQRFARAKKSIGTYHYVRKNYEAAIENYELALQASPSNISILSLLAYTCLSQERYERAAECYRNLTYQDNTSFLAWNNLSKAYIKLNQKERAWRTLREAIKCNFEEWKIWENFMIVSVEIGALDDVIQAWHRIIDLKSSHKDDQILSAFTYSILKRSYEKNDREFMKLLADALKLVARISTTGACSPRTWICYFRLLAREYDLKRREQQLSKMDIDARVSKMTNALQRATPNTLLFEAHWHSEASKVDKLLSSYDELIDCYGLAVNLVGPRREIWSQWKSFRLAIGNALKVLRQKGYGGQEE